MTAGGRCLAVIPARGGSKTLPGKNIRPFMGIPLVAHTILFASLCQEIDRCIVSTDSPEITQVAKQFGAEIPFIRPAELAQDDTSMWPVIRQALAETEKLEGAEYDLFLLLDPTSPAREPADVTESFRLLEECPSADGIIGVSKPDFNPIWTCVTERDGWMTGLMHGIPDYQRRQDVPAVYRINGCLYLWRTQFIRTHEESWKEDGNYLMYQIPEFRAMSIDDAHQFRLAELMVDNGLISFPWLSKTAGEAPPGSSK